MSADVNWHNELRNWIQQCQKRDLEEWESRVARDPSLVILQRDTSGTCDPALFEKMDKADWSWVTIAPSPLDTARIAPSDGAEAPGAGERRAK